MRRSRAPSGWRPIHSVGSIVGFTAYIVGTILSINNDIPPVAVVLMAVAMGAVMGSINGLLVAYGRVPAIIVVGLLLAAQQFPRIGRAILVKQEISVSAEQVDVAPA